VMSDGVRRLESAMSCGAGASLRRRSDVARSAIDHRLAGSSVYSTGIETLDLATGGGARLGQMVTLEARTSGGKSALVVTWALSIARQGGKVLLSSSELSPEDYEERMVAAFLNMTQQQMLVEGERGLGKLAANRDEYLDKILDNIWYLDRHLPTVDTLHRELLRGKAEYGITHLIQDSFQDIGGKGDYIGAQEDFNKSNARELRSIVKRQNINLLTTTQIDKKAIEALEWASTIYIRLHREDNDNRVDFDVPKSTGGVPRTTREYPSPPAILYPAGPHIGNPKPEDYAEEARRCAAAQGGDAA